VLVVTYSLALPYVLALYRLALRIGASEDGDKLAERLRALDDSLRAGPAPERPRRPARARAGGAGDLGAPAQGRGVGRRVRGPAALGASARVLLHAARRFEAAASVATLVVVVPEPELESARALLAGLAKLGAVVAGGPRRQDSVLEGMKQAPDDFKGIVLVHDAARPFAEPVLIDAVERAARQHGAALPVLGLVDTVKRVRDGRVLETLERSELGAAQTPQGFRFELLVRAYEAAFRDRATITDEAMAVERLGEPVAVIPGSERNRKLTTPEDLAWAEGVLAGVGRAP
jgi:2-C-methyl-D-erythritol 4-phosphate cytidylyltransferase